MAPERYLNSQVERDLRRKMVFVAGPRQVGKTTLAQSLPGAGGGYLNWDVAEDRERILRRELPPTALWVFDEIHKYRSWRDYLKGLYDGRGRVSRSSSPAAPASTSTATAATRSRGAITSSASTRSRSPSWVCDRTTDLGQLLTLGGFPEPFFGGLRGRGAPLVARVPEPPHPRGAVASLERVQDLGSLELLVLRLPELVGSPLSINALREDLQVSHKTVASWVRILERLYAVFRLPPFGAPRIRAVKKEQKHYHFDWSLVPDDGGRFENLVASHLLKWVHFEQDAKAATSTCATSATPTGARSTSWSSTGSARPHGREQALRRQAGSQPAVPQAALSGVPGLADFGGAAEGLSLAGGCPGLPGVGVPRHADLTSPPESATPCIRDRMGDQSRPAVIRLRALARGDHPRHRVAVIRHFAGRGQTGTWELAVLSS